MFGSSGMMMPLLARGRHRNPRRGACFMELASYLAGEAWSDCPSCTDESLANLARMVNDLTSDAERPRLAEMIPAVIGLRGLGHGFADEVALIAAASALPVAAEARQRGLAVGLLRLIGEIGDYRTAASAEIVAAARKVLAEHESIQRWAHRYAERVAIAGDCDALIITEVAVRGIAEACIHDPDMRLRALLRSSIQRAQQRLGTSSSAVPTLQPQQWAGVVRQA